MLFDSLIDWIAYALNAFFNLFPVGTGFGSQFLSAFTTFGGYTAILDPLISWSDLFYCLTVVFSVQLSLVSYTMLRGFVGFIFKR